MKTVATHTLSFDEFDDLGSSKPEYAEFDDVVERAISRRGFLSGVLSVGASTFVMGVGAGVSTSAEAAGRFGFIPVSADTLDTVTLPDGFNWHVVVKWGDELFDDSIPFDEESRGNSDSQAKAFGDNNDGMSLFTRDGKTILVVNNEYANRSIIFGNRQSQMPETDDDVKKGMIAHGITVCEISNTDGTWRLVKGSGVNRRITPESVIEIAGPASGH
ncbi:MAG: alkaline phosphatase PhoX, partial [Pseudomonadota bacterium]